jgi:hypothetical protein
MLPTLQEAALINLGPGEFVLIGLALVLVFGAGRLPALGDAIGRALRGKGPPQDGSGGA